MVTKLSYASPAWWGYAYPDDKARLEVFLRRSLNFRPRADSAWTLPSICVEADDKLFRNVLYNKQHLLHPLCLLLDTTVTASEIWRIIISSSHSESSLNARNFFIWLILKLWAIAKLARIKSIYKYSLRPNIILSELLPWCFAEMLPTTHFFELFI